jgi:hypothetical protein
MDSKNDYLRRNILSAAEPQKDGHLSYIAFPDISTSDTHF